MAKRYNQGVSVSSTRFTKAPMGEIQFSKFYGQPTHNTTFNAGDIIPIYCAEVLPHDTWDMSVDEVIRQATLQVPTMDRSIIDIFAYFVPNRVVNKSWVNVMGENTSSSWAAEPVALAPLVDTLYARGQIRNTIPVGSVADYYGFPTQQAIPLDVLQSCHDLKFRGYLEIYNTYFRDQNYQPPIPYSKLNVYNGFLVTGSGNAVNTPINFGGDSSATVGSDGTVFSEYDNPVSPDGSYGAGAIAKELYGSEGVEFLNINGGENFTVAPRVMPWRAYFRPLKANKLHDYFTSVLPSPQKGDEVVLGLLSGTAPVVATSETHNTLNPVILGYQDGPTSINGSYGGILDSAKSTGIVGITNYGSLNSDSTSTGVGKVNMTNLAVDLSTIEGGVLSVGDLRMSAAVQQVYEILGRSGSRYTEYVNAFFGLDTDNPFLDIPTCLGHIRRDLELYQTAQTSASTSTSAQGDLAAFGYTSTGGHLFTRTFLEHGYIHIMAVVRQKNIYSSMMSRDNFRRSFMDFYQYPLANISEQPVFTREINPFAGNTQVFGYQEAWAEYRVEPDRVSGLMRPGVELSLAQWTLADDFDSSLLIADGDFMESNAESVIARGTALTDEYAPQFKGKFTFKITKQRPLPTYSVSGMDII